MNNPTQREFHLKLPMRIRTSTKKVTPFNLNVYRNLHFRSLTALKHKFQDHAKDLISTAKIPPLGRIRLHYQVFVKTKRKLDIANVCSIVDKFFCDALQQAKIIREDDYDHLDFVSFGFGGLAAEEYVRVTITEIEPRKDIPMRILLEEHEIQKALEDFVETLGLANVSGVDLSTDDDGNVTAEVMIGEEEEESTPKKTRAPRKNKGGRPAGSKNKPKEEPEKDVEDSGTESDDTSGPGDAEPSQPEAEEQNDGAEEPSSKPKAASKNLFGDEETESSKSDSPETKEEGPKPKGKGLFDI
jgi:hypothetical protein